MAEQQGQGGTQGGSPAASGGSAPAQAGQAAPGASGPEPAAGGQASQQPPAQAGQGGAAAPASAPATDGAAKPGEGTAAPAAKKTWDADTERWMKSKGYDTAALDPANESHAKLISSQRKIESEFTRQRQQERNQEILNRAKKVEPQAAPAAEELSPLQEFEQVHEWTVNQALQLNGVQSIEELKQRNAAAADYLQTQYVTQRQIAWEKDQEWKAQKANADREREAEEGRFRQEYEEAKRLTTNNLDAVRSKNQNLDADLTASGAENVIASLENRFSLFRELMFTDPSVVQWFAEAAEAIQYRKSESDRRKTWQQEYEKEQLEARRGQAPAPSGTGTVRPDPAFVRPRSWSETLDQSVKK